MRTIRAKIILLFVVIFGFTLSLFSGVLYFLYARQSAQNFDLNLSNDALEIAGIVKSDSFFNQDFLSGITGQPAQQSFGPNRYVQVISITTGQIVLKSSNLQKTLPISKQIVSLALKGNQVFETLSPVSVDHVVKNSKMRLVTYPVFDDGIPRYLIQVGASTSTLDESMFQLRLLLLLGVPLSIIAAAAGGFYLAKKAFDPIDRIIRTAQSISVEHLDKRLDTGRVDDEITRLSKTLNAMFDRIEEAFKLQKQFTADASHELKTPLTILLGEIEVALKNPRTTQDYVGILTSAVEEIKRITNIVEELLTMARLESGLLQLQKKPVRIDELMLDAISKTSAYASKRSISISYEVQNKAEEEHEEVIVDGDRDKLLSVLMNLLDNAIKYSEENGTIRVVQSSNDNSVELKIIDRGIGIPPEDLPYVFDRFYRADKSRSSEGVQRGSGLGLSISKSLAEAHGGKIKVESGPGAGTTVTVELPLSKYTEPVAAE
ncbi:MAG: ATP-binding protein [Bacteroidetes bacterium]|nr:ATP-binding protein [Bacteroidota bacterium]